MPGLLGEKLKVGGKYIAKNGDVVLIWGRRRWILFPTYFGSNGKRYSKFGKHRFYRESLYSLVSVG